MGRARRLRYRHLRRTIIALLAAVATILLVVLVGRMLLTASPTRRLAKNWITAAAHQRGFDLTMEDLSWSFFPLRITCSGVLLDGRGIRAEVETAHVDPARIRLASQTIELGTVAADGVRLSLDNPAPAEDRDPSNLKVRVHHLQLSRVVFEGTGLPGRVDLKLDGMDLGWSSPDGVPAGVARIDRVDLDVPGINPLSFAVAARLRLENGLQLPSWTVNGTGIDLTGHGRIGGGEGTSISASGEVALQTVDEIVKAGGILEGRIAVDAVFRAGGDELLAVEVEGRRLSAAGFPLSDVGGRLILTTDELIGHLDRAVFHGGRLNGVYTLERRKDAVPHTVRITGRGVAVSGILANLGIPPAGIAADLDTDVALSWDGRSFPLGRGRADVVFHPTDGPLPTSGPLTVGLNGDRALTFSTEEVRIGSSVMAWQGPLAIGSWQPSWSVTAAPAVFEEIVPMVNAWIGSDALPAVEGEGRLQVSLNGPWQELLVNARLDARPLRWGPMGLDHVVASALVGGSRLTLKPSRFSIGGGTGEIEGTMSWDPEAGDRQLGLDIRGHQIPISTLAEWAGQDGMADGSLSFTGGLRGPLALPKGSWAAGLTDVTLAGLALGDANATVDLADGRFTMRGISFDEGLSGQAWWQVMAGELSADLAWDDMPLDFMGEAFTDTVGGTARVRLTGLLPPDGNATGRLEAETDGGRIEVLAEADSWQVEGRLDDAVIGSAELLRTPDGRLAGAGRFRLTSAESLLARVAPEVEIPLRGTAAMSVDVDWEPGSLPMIHGTIDEVGLHLDEEPVRLLGAAHLVLDQSGLEVEDLYLAHRNDRVFLRWGIGADGSIRGNATGTMDALLLRLLVPDWEPAGRATGVIEMLGSLDRPRFEGIAEISQGSFRLPGGQTIISGIDGTVLLSEDEVVVDGSGFRFMQGRGLANGRISRREGVVSLDLAGEMTDLRYDVFPGLVARLSGPWRLTGPTHDLHISGDLRVDRATLQRRDDPAVLILEWFGGVPAPPGEGGPSLDLHVEADQTIELRNPFVRLVGSGSLHITGTTNRPGLVGKVEFEEGGEITLQNLRYDLERGNVTFSDPERIDPSVEIQLRTWVQNYQVTLRVSGTSDRLIPQVTSNPPLPQEEVYSLLAMGYRSDTFGSGAMGIGLASTLLSQQLASELDRRTKLVLPQVRVDPFSDSTSSGTSARVTVVQQLAPNWTVTLSSNLSAERSEVIVSRWYLAPGIFLEASRQLDGSYGIDIKMRRPY